MRAQCRAARNFPFFLAQINYIKSTIEIVGEPEAPDFRFRGRSGPRTITYYNVHVR